MIDLFLLFRELAKMCPKPVEGAMDDPHTKAHLLYQAHFSQLSSLNSDYLTDQKSVLDQGVRILQVREVFYLFEISFG